jgi:HK97 family phage portal protein
VSVPNDDAQFLESRKFGIEEIARWFGLPLSRLRVQGAQAFVNIEQDGIDFVVNTLRPHLVRIEQEINVKLFPHGDYFCEHSVEGLLRGDIATRYNTYQIGRMNGWLSINDVRHAEYMPPIEGGDQYMQPLNMAAVNPPVVPPVQVAPLNSPNAPPSPFQAPGA